MSEIEPSSWWACKVSGCPDLGLLHGGPCRVCQDRYCRRHALDSQVHECYADRQYWVDNQENPLQDLWRQRVSHLVIRPSSTSLILQRNAMFDNVDIPFILNQAKALGPGHGCSIPSDPKQRFITGCMNFHLDITFDDGVRWLARLREPSSSEAPEPTMLCIRSAVATVQLLHQASIPVPNARMPLEQHGKAFSSQSLPPDDPDQLRFSFIDFLSGTEHEPFDQTIPIESPTLLEHTMINSLAEWLIKLETLTFESVGSVYEDPKGGFEIGPIISMIPTSGSPPYFIGPFKSAKDRYVALFTSYMDQILDGARSVESDVLRDYLVALEMKNLVAGCREMQEGPFYLQHPDEHGDQVLFDEHGAVTGVIDWDW